MYRGTRYRHTTPAPASLESRLLSGRGNILPVAWVRGYLADVMLIPSAGGAVVHIIIPSWSADRWYMTPGEATSASLGALSLTESGDSLLNGEEFFDTSEHLEVESGGASALALVQSSPAVSITTLEGDPPDVEEDTDDLGYEDMEGVMSSNKSIVLAILSQFRIGMDLTRFVMPVFILERRSLLELYAEFFAHPDILTSVDNFSSPKDRMIEVVRWFLSSISASKKGAVPKKPYNPVLGETFHCYWDMPGGKRTPPDQRAKVLLESGPVPYAGYDSLTLVAEQVSHHPPISAFYGECPSKNICISGTIGTKTKFLGLSVKAQNTGSVIFKFMNHGEEYICQLPNGYVRSILTVPWFEFGGECGVECPQSGYRSKIDFHTKPFRGGKKHRVTAEICHKSDKSPCYKVEGEWNAVLYGKTPNGEQKVFFDCANSSTIRKKWKKISSVESTDSRVVWRHVTEAIRANNAGAAADAKHQVEEKQRAEAKERAKTGAEFQHKYFHKDVGDTVFWSYRSPLDERTKHV